MKTNLRFLTETLRPSLLVVSSSSVSFHQIENMLFCFVEKAVESMLDSVPCLSENQINDDTVNLNFVDDIRYAGAWCKHMTLEESELGKQTGSQRQYLGTEIIN
jgi:hypothetical protein